MKEGWTYKKLGEITTTINGLWTGKKPPFINVAVVRNTNFTKDCKLDLSNVAYLDVEEKQYKTRKLQYGDIIIEKSGGSEKQPVGRPVLFNKKEGEFSFSNFTSTLRINNKEDIDPHFLHYALISAYFRGVTGKMQAKTTGIHNLDFKAYLKLLIPYTTISEQQLIVSELDLLSGVIDKQKAQIEELDKLAQSIFYDMFGDPVTNEKGWVIFNIKDIIEVIGGYAFKSSEYTDRGVRLVQISNVWKDNLTWEDKTYVPLSIADSKNSFYLKPGDIVMALTRPIIKSLDTVKVAMVNEIDTPCVLNQRVCKYEVNKKKVNSIWFFNFTKTVYFKEKINFFSSKGMQPNVSTKEIEKIEIPLPPLPLQQEFAVKIEAIEAIKAKARQSLKESEQLFNSRMDYYFI